ncbi:MAG: hypothetical protein ACYTGH_11620 [Planctomycetota bacterium]
MREFASPDFYAPQPVCSPSRAGLMTGCYPRRVGRWSTMRCGRSKTPTVRHQRLEEPNLLFTNGKPPHLFNILGACPEDPVYSGHVFAID